MTGRDQRGSFAALEDEVQADQVEREPLLVGAEIIDGSGSDGTRTRDLRRDRPAL